MTSLKTLGVVVALLAALVAQVSLLPQLVWHGIVPNVVLLVVVVIGLTRSPNFALVAGFGGGLLLDLAPPADHLMGRWALSLLLVAYVASRLRLGARPTALGVLAVVATCSLVGTSVFALSGLLLGEGGLGVLPMLGVIGIALVLDLSIVLLGMPFFLRGLRVSPASGAMLR